MFSHLVSPRGAAGTSHHLTAEILREELRSFAARELRIEVTDAVRICLSEHLTWLRAKRSGVDNEGNVDGEAYTSRADGLSSMVTNIFDGEAADIAGEEHAEAIMPGEEEAENVFESHPWMMRHVRCNKLRASVLKKNKEKRGSQWAEIGAIGAKSQSAPVLTNGRPLQDMPEKLESFGALQQKSYDEPVARRPSAARSHPATDSVLPSLREETLINESSTLLDHGLDEEDQQMPEETPTRPFDWQSSTDWRAAAEVVLSSWQFDCAVGMVIAANAAAIGWEVDYRARRAEAQEEFDADTIMPAQMELIEIIFATFFTMELCLRLWVHRCAFFLGVGWQWNLFDFTIVVLQILDQSLHSLTWIPSLSTPNVSFLRMLRLLRLIRITRLIRVLRLIEELRTIVASIMGSLRSLVWTLVLLLIMIYTASVCFTQVVLDAGITPHRSDLQMWFGRLGRTVLTMFECISGGVSWDAVVVPLVMDVGPMIGVLFCLYVAFCVLAMMNVVTGVFVQKAIQNGQEDKDNYLANHISDLFFREIDGIVPEEITWKDFERCLTFPDMQDYFKEMNVDVSEARGLFRLLDVNNSGSVDCAEVVNGCLRLRGPAKALEMHLLLHESTRMRQRLVSHQSKVEAQLKQLQATLEPLLAPGTAPIDNQIKPVLLPAGTTGRFSAPISESESMVQYGSGAAVIRGSVLDLPEGEV